MPKKKAKSGHRSNKKGTSAVTKISHLAQKIRKDHPSIKWQSAIKQASAEYRKNK